MTHEDRLKAEYAALYPDDPTVYKRLVRGEDPAKIAERLGPRGRFVELQAHLGIAESDRALRSLLGAPDTLPLRQWYMEVPVKSRRLAGCQWRLIGTVLPMGLAHGDLPEFPFFQYGYPQPTCMQVWLWRTFKPHPPPYPRHPSPDWCRPFGDIRWHPERGVWVALELNPDDGPAVAQQVREWVYASELASRGRPKSRQHSHRAVLHTVCAIILRRVAHGDAVPNQRQAAAWWNAERQTDPRASAAQVHRGNRSAETALYRARRTFNLTWEDVINLALAPLKK